jgi:hypothetical protein
MSVWQIGSILIAVHREDSRDLELRNDELVGAVRRYSASVSEGCVSAGTLELAVMQGLQEDMRVTRGLLCGALQATVMALNREIAPSADELMALLMQVLGVKSGAAAREEAVMCVGTVASAVGGQAFEKYMLGGLTPLLVEALQEQKSEEESGEEQHQVGAVTMSTIGDIGRALEGRLLIHCDKLLPPLLQRMETNEAQFTFARAELSHMPQALSCIGDIALAINHDVTKYREELGE